MKQPHLRRQFVLALLALGVALAAAGAATFAWYIYNTSAHTTKVHMAAGTSVALYISNAEGGPYTSSAVLDAFSGTLNPVSTNRIQNGFQKVYGFTNGSENRGLLASLFTKSDATDYYKTSLWLKTDGAELPVYLSDIGFEDSDANNPISTAIRVGFVNPANGEEKIFAINTAANPGTDGYNTLNGKAGDVLDSTKTDGSTLTFTPLTKANFCQYDKETGATSLLADSTQLLTATATPTQLDIYIWLEGCDEDCTQNLCAATLKNLALAFCGIGKDATS